MAWLSVFSGFLFGPGFKVPKGAARWVVRGALLVLMLALGLALSYLVGWSRGSWSGLDPRSDLALLAGVLLLRAPLALVLAGAAVLLAVVLFRVLERSRLGHQLLRWRDGEAGGSLDPENVPAARTLGGLVLLGALAVGVCQVFAAVLR